MMLKVPPEVSIGRDGKPQGPQLGGKLGVYWATPSFAGSQITRRQQCALPSNCLYWQLASLKIISSKGQASWGFE